VVEARHIALSAWLRRYFQQFMGISPTPTTLREYRMEEVFKDASYDFRETPNDAVALNGYIDLVDLYLRVLRETTNWLCAANRKGAPVGQFLAACAKHSDDLTVITFNHDLVIENEIARRARLRHRWCLDEGYGSLSSSFTPLFPGAGTATFPLHRAGLCDHHRPITVLKLHGSMNWLVRINSTRPTARFLSRGGGSGDLNLVTRRQIAVRQQYVRTGGGRGRTRWDLWPLVVPPVYAKQELRAAALQQVWTDARTAIEGAERLLFFGYSLPELDVEAEKLFERALLKNSNAEWIDVINPASESASRFAGMSPSRPVRWYPALRDFFSADSLAA
jgi:hypothetical protein